MAVKYNKADAAAYDEPILKNISAKSDGIKVLDGMITYDNYGFAVNQNNLKLKLKIDEILVEIRSNGTYDKMMQRWLPEKGGPAAMPKIELEAKEGILRFATSSVTEPFSFLDTNGKIVGFDIEIAHYIAKSLNMDLEIVNMDFGAMIPALAANKVDLIGACITISDERKKSVLFSEPYYKGGIAALVKAE